MGSELKRGQLLDREGMEREAQQALQSLGANGTTVINRNLNFA